MGSARAVGTTPDARPRLLRLRGVVVTAQAHSLDLSAYAEPNGIIVLHPQAKGVPAYQAPHVRVRVHARTHTCRYGAGDNGCWNWGACGLALDPLYDTQRGAQIKMVANMVVHITQLIRSATSRPYGSGPPAADHETPPRLDENPPVTALV